MIVLRKMAEDLRQLVEDSFDPDFTDSPSKMRKLRAAADGLASVTLGMIADGKPTPQVIRTVRELEALDPDTVLGVWNEELEMGCIFLKAREWILEDSFPPLTVIANGEYVRAVQKALKDDQR